MIYNSAPHYREGIFALIDKEYDCDWYFGKPKDDIKEMDYSLLRNVKFLKTIGNPRRIYIKLGMVKLLFKKKYQTFFMLNDIRSVSDWIFYVIAFIFLPKKNIYLWTHGWYGKEKRWEGNLKLWLYNHVKGVFVYGDRAKKLLIERGLPSEKIFPIHNSLDYNTQYAIRKILKPTAIYQNHFGNKNPVIIFIGRLTKIKRLDMLIRAVKILNARNVDCNLVLIGNGEDKESLINLVSDLCINDKVWFYGPTYDEKEKAELIYNADLCVAPGNVGLTAMDSLVFGTPVISHDNFAWQMPEFESIIPNISGNFFKYQDLNSLIETIDLWFKEHLNNRQEIRNACFRIIDTAWNPEYQIQLIKKIIK